MSIYTDLLRRAVDSDGSGQEQGGELLAILVRRRSDLVASPSSPINPSRPLTGLAAQLAYDSALVSFARHLGIETSPESFDPPQVERTRLERAVAAHNVALAGLDEEVRPS